MHVFATLVGGLLGVLPGLLLVVLGQSVTSGGDGMIGYGMGGVALMVVGVVAGAVWGWRNHEWFSSHLFVSMLGGLVSAVAIVVVWVAVSGSPDPILIADNCVDVYHRLGLPEEETVDLVLPSLTDDQIEKLDRRLPQLARSSDGDEGCRQLRAALEAQREERGD